MARWEIVYMKVEYIGSVSPMSSNCLEVDGDWGRRRGRVAYLILAICKDQRRPAGFALYPASQNSSVQSDVSR